MLDTEVYVKTDAGRDEIKSRRLGLPMAERAILLMVDGQRDVASMRTLIAGSKAPAGVLDVLLAHGLIAPRTDSTPAPPIAAPAPPPRPIAPSIAPVAPRVVYDGPIDLVLPTIHGPSSSRPPPPAPSPVAMPAPPPRSETVEIPQAAPSLDRYEHLYAMMNEIVRDFLAPHRRYFFQLKIERCTTADELLELLHDLQTVLSKSRGQAFASEVIARLRSAAA